MGIIETIKLITREEALEEGLERGIQKERIEGKTHFVENLLSNTDFDTAKIAMLADVSEDFVGEIQKQR